MKFVHPAGRLALAQTAIGLLGLVASFISMRLSQSEDWLPWARVVRYGWPLLLAAPLLWMLVAVRKEANDGSDWSETTTLWTGLTLAAVMLALFTVTALYPSHWHVSPISEVNSL